SWSEADVPRRLASSTGPDAQRPTGATFSVAHELLGSAVERRLCSVYELSPERVGTCDVVFLSDLLLHLRDPQRALESIFSVIRPDGYLLLGEPFNPALEGFD